MIIIRMIRIPIEFTLFYIGQTNFIADDRFVMTFPHPSICNIAIFKLGKTISIHYLFIRDMPFSAEHLRYGLMEFRNSNIGIRIFIVKRMATRHHFLQNVLKLPIDKCSFPHKCIS